MEGVTRRRFLGTAAATLGVTAGLDLPCPHR